MSKTESLKSLEERRAHWRALVDEAREGGGPPSQFCQARGVSLARFYYWRQALAKPAAAADPAAHFALVGRGLRQPPAGSGELELQVDGGWRLRIPRGVDPATQRAVLGALRQSA